MPTITSNDVLTHSITALRAFKESSSAISAVPALPAVVGAVLEIVVTIDASTFLHLDLINVKENKELLSKLRTRTIEFGTELIEGVKKSRDAIDPSLDFQLRCMLTALHPVQRSLVKMSQQGAVSSWMRHGSNKTKLEDHAETINDMRLKYLVSDALPSNVALFSVPLNYHSARWYLHWLTMLKSKPVLLTELWNPPVLDVDTDSSCVIVSNSRRRPGTAVNDRTNSDSPNIARYLGRSHPNEPQVFVVSEIGNVTAREYFRSPRGTLEKLRCYLNMPPSTLKPLAQDLSSYIRDVDLYVPTDCLSSLSVRQDGSFVVLAEDLRHTHAFCLQAHLLTMLDEACWRLHRPVARQKGVKVTPKDQKGSMMRILDCEMRPTAISVGVDDLYTSPLVAIYSYYWCMQNVQVALGDYGYVNRQQGHFVPVGNVFEFLRRERSVFVHDYMQRFWWLYARSIADYHGIPLEELVVGPVTLFFHRSPLLSYGEVPSPFGYWSLDSEPSPGPWPDIPIPGLNIQYSPISDELDQGYADSEQDDDDDGSSCSDSASSADDECYETPDEGVDD
ncbi:hypothetical protein CERSUDRAFT_72517 [Gelatoporia subvermispora B]|uniref:Uncharacterized protein n=1 Tax=Ceriporiopsis subvermispora (strain B) TaxID=914234 RepID=M2R485_CERS8|nr:hypothetical protein CERSUDRAFT_72517 [Gelatoporia subvermispora B]